MAAPCRNYNSEWSARIQRFNHHMYVELCPRHKLDGKYLQLMLMKFRLESDMRFTEIHLNNTLVFNESNSMLTVVVMPIIVAFRRTESF